MKADVIQRIGAQIEARYQARAGWWEPLLGRVQRGQVCAVRGPWPLQRHVLAHVLTSFHCLDVATLRGPTSLLESVIEETLTVGAAVPRDTMRSGALGSAEWARLAEASGRLDGAGLELVCVDRLEGVELEAGARWCFGMSVAHPDIEIEVVDEDDGIVLHALDGRCGPPARRCARLRAGRLRTGDDDGDNGDDHGDDGEGDAS